MTGEACMDAAVIALFANPPGQAVECDEEGLQTSLVAADLAHHSCSMRCYEVGCASAGCTAAPEPSVKTVAIPAPKVGAIGCWGGFKAHLAAHKFAYYAIITVLLAICLTAAAMSTPLSTADAPMPVSLAGTCDAALGEVAWSPDTQRALVTSASSRGYQNEPGGGFGRLNLLQLFGSFLLLAGTVFVLWPVWGSFAFLHMPFDYATAAAYGLATPLIGAFPKAFASLNTASGGTILSQAAKSVNRVRQLTPWFATCLLLLSAAFIGTCSQHATGSSVSAVDAFSGQADLFTGTGLGNGTGATSPVVRVNLPYEGQWLPPDAKPDVTSSTEFVHIGNTLGTQSALVDSNLAAKCDARATKLPIFHAHPDSGCTGSVTDDCRRLINQRKCAEIYGQANGQLTHCSVIGDMPVYAKTSEGTVIHFTIKNVRCVPSFKYTLLSVRQLWKEQNVDARFRDLDYLELPSSSGGHLIPYDASINLYTLVLVSASSASPPCAQVAQHPKQTAYVGFHQPGSVAHIERMSSARAGALIHRRSHLSVVKIRNFPNTAADATKNLSSAPKVTCVPCARAEIRAASHSGKMDTSVAQPGDLHVDMKGPYPRSVTGGFCYALFFIDQHTRYVMVEFIKTKDEVLNATKRAMAKFDALVGVPTDDDGKPLERPRVRSLHRDREGQYESHGFKAFQADHSLYSTTSAPYDHDLNPIAESTINVIDTMATKFKLQSNAPVGFWPEAIRHAVNWHNASSTSVGSSSADPAISAHQRFTGKLPKIMDLCTFGARVVVLKSTPHRSKGDLSGRGWVGCFLGRSSDARGCYEAWIPSLNKTVSNSSMLIDEEYLPWLGKDAHVPLEPARSHPAADTLVGGGEPPPVVANTHAPQPINSTPVTSLSFLNLFSGPMRLTNGLSAHMTRLGWAQVTEVDNDERNGGGWDSDLLNDSCYADLLARARRGDFHAIMIAFPCSTFSIARFFDASGDGGDKGPQAVRSKSSPDGLPNDKLDPKHRKELLRANRLLERTVDIAIAANLSSSKTSIVWENPADRSIVGTTEYMPEFADKHGSLFATSAIRRFREQVPNTSQCTFASCRLGSDSQKYTTLLYTNDAARVLDPLNGPEYACNHPPGSHHKTAGGRDRDGQRWISEEAAAYKPPLCNKLAQAFTWARTGANLPVPKGTATNGKATIPTSAPLAASPPVPTSPPLAASSPSPLAASSHSPPFAATSPPSPSASSPGAPSPVAFRGFNPVTNTSTPINLGAGVPIAPKEYPLQGRPHREVRKVVADARKPDLATIEESNSAPSYVGFGGTPNFPEGSAADLMEATVTELVVDAYGSPSAHFNYDPAGPWTTISETALTARLDDTASYQGDGVWVQEVKYNEMIALINAGSCTASEHSALLSTLTALRAESDDAPSTHAQAQTMGSPWPEAVEKELSNHLKNGSWATITRSEVPKGRRLHKMVWVFKLKRDGVAKARLCVQGCTLEKGVDFDQTFAKTLLHSSARGLFAYAARNRCKVRSVDYVAAYLQGEFIDGEDVYCHAPPGSVEIGSDGLPKVCRVIKPIYGIPQAGRRLQRLIFPWCIETMGLRQLDDSDGCVFVWDDPQGKETFAVGIYVDNLQIVHSAELNGNGDAIDPNSYYAKFITQLRKEWDVVDEGPMQDLLGVEVMYKHDGGITLHQTKYIQKMLERFYPDGVHRNGKISTPYTPKLREHVLDALLKHSTSDSPLYPELLTDFQQRLGSLMYATNASRCDIAYPVHQLCQCMMCPTPEIMQEIDQCFYYLSRNMHLSPGVPIGLNFDPGPSELSAFSDASWEVKNSTSGWCIFWQNALLHWGSRKQKCVSLSSCEAEIYALSEAAKDVVYLRKFVNGLEPRSAELPTLLRTDNKAARDLSYNPEQHQKTKHIARRHFFVRDMVESFELQVPLVGTADNCSDFFTKALDSKSFFRFRNVLMNLPKPQPEAALWAGGRAA